MPGNLCKLAATYVENAGNSQYKVQTLTSDIHEALRYGNAYVVSRGWLPPN